VGPQAKPHNLGRGTWREFSWGRWTTQIILITRVPAVFWWHDRYCVHTRSMWEVSRGLQGQCPSDMGTGLAQFL
jgi:hypothetical protein